jgi:UDP-N-acetylmuramate dehydrogenase
MKRYLGYRRERQDATFVNAGCIFKNPAGESAGRLIDLCGLKGKRIGDAYISKKHANFILNKGHARARDVLQLMRLVKKRVKDKFNINLEPEIKIWQ